MWTTPQGRYVYVYVCVHACICACVCMCVCMRACVCMCMYVCMYRLAKYIRGSVWEDFVTDYYEIMRLSSLIEDHISL